MIISNRHYAFVVSEPCDPNQTLLENKMPCSEPLPYSLIVSLDQNIKYQTDYEPSPPLSPEISALLLQTDIQSMTSEQILQKGGNTSDIDQAINVLEFGIQKFGTSDLGNKIRLRLMRKYMAKKDFSKCAEILDYVKTNGIPEDRARALLQESYLEYKKGNRDIALGKFQDNTKDPNLPPVDRLDAGMRVAAIYHVKRDYPSSYLAYHQIALSNSPVNVKAFSEMYLLALEMELSRSQKGKLEECIKYADAICAKYPTAPLQILSTTHLMQLECHYWLKQYDKTLELISKHRQDFPDEKREKWSTVYWEGCALGRLGRYDEAVQPFMAYRDMDLPPDKFFAGKNPRLSSADWLSWLYNQMGDKEKSEYWRQELQKIRQEMK